MGGLTFNMLESRDLEYDRTAYLQGRDEDAVSISTGTVLSAAIGGGAKQQKEGDYFEARRQDYYAGGVGGTPFEDDGYYGANGTPGDAQYEMKAFESTEQLISPSRHDQPYYDQPPPLPPLRMQSSGSTIVGGRHQPNSRSSVDYSYGGGQGQGQPRDLASSPADQVYTQSPGTSSPRQDSRPSSRQDSRGYFPSQANSQSQSNYQHQPRQQSLSSTSNVYPPQSSAPSYTSHQQTPSNSSFLPPTARSNSPYLHQSPQASDDRQPSNQSQYDRQQGGNQRQQLQHSRNQSSIAMSNSSSQGSSAGGRPTRNQSQDPYARDDQTNYRR